VFSHSQRFQFVVLIGLFPMFSFAKDVLPGRFTVTELPNDSFEMAQTKPVQSSISKRPGAALSKARTAVRSKGSIASGTCAVSTTHAFRTGLGNKVSIPAALKKENPVKSQNPLKAAEGLPELAVIDVILDQILNIGKKVWTVVDAGKPVVDLSSDVATALPTPAPGQHLCWTQLENWQAPQSHVFGVTFTNLFGAEVVKLRYRVMFVSGGSYQGQGRYIGYAAVDPMVDVIWGYNAKITAEVLSVLNTGNQSSPIAGMNLKVTYTVETALKTATESKVYYITGLGDFEELE
jgi:hypothetical protein